MNLERVFVRVVLVTLVICSVSCKKKKAFKNENGQGSEDVRSVQAQSDEVARDLNTAIKEQPLLRGGVPTNQAVRTQICGAEIDTLSVANGVIRLHYLGATCNGVKKTGTIVATLTDYPTTKWKNQGCSLKIEFLSYKVIQSNGKLVQFDGTAYMKNLSGNTWYEMMNGLTASSLIQTQMTEGLVVTYDGNNTAVFNMNRSLTYNYTGSVTSCRIEGLGSSEGKSNLDNWGQDRIGNNFTTEINSALVWKSNCGINSLTAGEQTLQVEGKEYDMKCIFAVNESGSLVSDENTCSYGWKASWTYRRKTNTRVFAY
ncbi:hypothetical protein CNR22_22570 [Sphingobacteriaceae bacterium]|nr:hypothetical protein CNR22_22570 [Sphingobacteriaceae bacterium]